MRLRSWSVMPSKESISNITISEASTVFKVFIIPIISRKLLFVLLFLLTPGVSTILKSYPNFLIGILMSCFFVYLMKNQVGIDYKQWIRRMIPHHSTALTSTNKLIENRSEII